MNAHRSQLKNSAALGALALMLLSAGANANPAGGTVSAGAATISSSQPGTLNIDQTTKIVIIDWNSFNIAKGETTNFHQPGADATAVNRIGGADPAKILGNLSANGKVILIDGNGILFGKNAQINVGGLLATTSNASNADILSGKATFDQAGNPNARIINKGHITAASGMVGLVAPSVVNDGVIAARLGQVTLGAANVFTVDFTGDGLISFPVDPSIIAGAIDAHGKPVKALVANNGRIEGQTVLLSARVAAALVTNVISVKGEVVAQGIGEKGGHIILDAGAGSVALAGAKLDASGANGGGDITVGSATAASVTVDAKSTLNVSATASGDGGSITVNSQNTTFHGTAKATGGATSGNGGKVETSGEILNIDEASIDTSAVNGITGNWLLDPANVTIEGATSGGTLSGGNFTETNDNATLSASALASALETTSVTVSTGNLSGTVGVITVLAPVTWNSANTLTLKAASTISIAAAITATHGGLYLSAGSQDLNNFTFSPASIIATAAVNVNTFTLGLGNWSQSSANLPAFTATNFNFDVNNFAQSASQGASGSGSFIRVAGGNGSAASPYQIADIYGLEGINFSGLSLTKNYKLVKDIDASGLADFNALGTDSSPDAFSGTLDGQGHAISNLTSTGSLYGMAGLFGWNFIGTVKNLTLSNVTIGGANATYAGAVAAQMGALGTGTITNVSVLGGTVTGTQATGGLVGANGTGTITGSSAVGVTVTQGGTGSSTTLAVGGLVGQNQGTITQSYATGAVNGRREAGGLVGYNTGTISQSYATGAVTLTTVSGSAGAASLGAGGLVGVNVVVTVTPGVDSLAAISQSYALGSVTVNNANTANVPIGSFVGANGGTITEGYGAGDVAVLAGSATQGGFAGINTAVNPSIQTKTGTLTNIYYDSSTTGQAGGLTTAQLQGTLPTGFNTLASGIWATGAGLYPYLAGFGVPQTVSGIAYKDAGVTPDASGNLGTVPVSLSIGGVAKGSVSAGANGYYYFQLPAGTISSGATVTATTAANGVTGAVNGVGSTTASASVSGLDILLAKNISGTVYSDYGVTALGNANVKEVLLSGGAVISTATSNATTGAYALNAPAGSGKVLLFLDNSNGKFANTVVDYAGSDVTGANLYAGYLNFYNTSSVLASSVLSQLSSFVAPTGGFSAGDFLFAGTTPTAGLAISATSANGFNLDTAINYTGSSGLAIKTTAGDLYVSNAVTLANGALTLDSFHDLNIGANLTVSGAGKVALKTNDGGTGGDFVFYNGNSLQFTGTANAGQALTINGNPYSLLYTMGDVQAINASNTALGARYALAKPLNASTTTGWIAIGSDGHGNALNANSGGFTGTLEGLGNAISNLTVNTGTSLDGSGDLGGLFGVSSGMIRDLGVVNASFTGGNIIGGVVGYNVGTVLRSYATGTITGTAYIGGLVGEDLGLISQSYSTAAVVGRSGTSGGATVIATDVGGLAGLVLKSGTQVGSVLNSYATGSVTAGTSKNVGGLIGLLGAVIVSNSYSTGKVTATGTGIGGGVGTAQNSPTITNLYWNSTTAGQATSAAGTSQTTAQLQAGPTGITSPTWNVIANSNPLLAWQAVPVLPLALTPPPSISGTVYSDLGVAALGNANVKEVFLTGGAVIASAVSNASTGAYLLNAPSSNGKVLLFLDNSSGKFADTILDYAGTSVTGANLYAGYLNFYNTAAISVSAALSQLSAFAAPTGGFSASDFLFTGTTLTAGLAISATSANGFVVDTALNVTGSNGLAIKTTVSDLYITAPMTVANGALTLDSFGSIDVGAGLTVTGTGKATITTNDGGAGGDYVFFNGQSLQFTGTANSGQALTINGSAYTLLYTAAAIQTANTLANMNTKYALAKPVDATGVTWNAFGTNGAGIALGASAAGALNGTTGFLGVFEGLGNTISNVTDTKTFLTNSTAGNSSEFVGVFGLNNGTIRDLGVLNVSLKGGRYVGGLVGANYGGTLLRDWATGAVTGVFDVAGLTGVSAGAIQQSWSSVLVTATNSTDTFSGFGGAQTHSLPQFIGGLVGANAGTITDVFATGNVVITGTGNATTSAAASAGASSVGGLIGVTEILSGPTSVTNAYTTGVVTNNATAAIIAGTFGAFAGQRLTTSTITNGYYNNSVTTMTDTATGVTGVSTAALQAGPTGLNGTNWSVGAGRNPLLAWQVAPVLPTALLAPPAKSISGTVYSDYGVTALGGATVVETLIGGGTAIATATSSGTGAYALNAPSSNGTLLLFLDNSNGRLANTVVNFTGADMTGVNLYGGYLNFINTSAVSVSAALTQLSGFTRPPAYAAGDFLFAGTTPTASLAISGAGGLDINTALNLGAGTLVLNMGGAVSQTAALTVGKLLLLNTAGIYNLGSAGNAIGTVAANAHSATVRTSAALTVGVVEGVSGVATVQGGILTAVGNLTIASGSKIKAGSTSLFSIASSAAFINNEGSDAVSAGEWLIYSADPTGDTFGNLNSGNTAVWNTAAGGSVSATGNRYVFANSPTLTVITTGAAKTYGTALNIANNYQISGLQAGVTGAYLGDSFSLITGAPTITSAGAAATAGVGSGLYAITAAQGTLAAAGYQFAFVNQSSLLVIPKTLTVSLTGSVTKVYDATTTATLAAGNYNLTGIVNSDAVTLNNPVTGSYADANAGSGKAVTVTGLALSGAAAGNYSLASSISGAVGTITPKPLTATLTGGITKTYDGGATATLAAANYALTGVISGDTVALAGLPTTGSYISKDVGTGLAVTSAAGISLTGASATNYTVASTATGMIGEITQKALTVALAATPVSRTYDTTITATLSAANFNLAGVVGTDAVNVANTAGSYDTKNVGSGKTVNVAGITLTGAQANDYFLPNPVASGTVGVITAATLTPTLATTTVERVYDGTTDAPVPTSSLGLTGILGSDSVNITSTGAAYDTKDAGLGKTVTVNGLALAGADAGNYALAATSLSAAVGRIDAATLTVVLAQLTGNVSKTYDSTTTATLTDANYLLTGQTPGDDVHLNDPTTGTFDTADAGSGKTVTVTGLTLGGAAAVDYTFGAGGSTISGAIGTIVPKTLTVSFNGAVTKTYDGTTSATVTAAGLSLNGLVNVNDAVSLNGVAGFYDTKDAGTGKAVTVNGLSLTGALAGDYQLAANNLTAAAGTITPKTVTATLNGAVEKTYDGGTGATVGLNLLSLTGVISGDTAGLTAPTSASFDTKDAGAAKTVTAAGLGLAGAQASDYALASTSVAAAIGIVDPKVITASLAGTPTKIYDGTAGASLTGANFALDGAVVGDDVGIAATAGAYDTANAGTGKTISVSGLVLSGVAAGDYILKGNAASGAVGVISPKGLTYTVANATSTFGTLAVPGAATLSGVLAADSANVSGTVGVFDSANNAVTLSATTNAASYSEKVTALSGGAAGNYVIAATGNTDGTLVINPLAVGISTLTYGVANATGTYGTLATLGAVTLTGVLAQDRANVGGTVGIFDINNTQQTLSATLSAGTYSEQITGLSGTAAANYVLATSGNSNGVLTIAPKTLTASLTGTVSGTYNGSTDALLAASNYSLSGVVGGDAVALNNPALGSFDTADAGTGKAVSVTGLALTGAGAANYVLGATSATGAIGTITPALLTAGLTGTVSKTYDGTTAAALTVDNYALNGVIGSDAVTLNNPAAGSFDTADAGTGKTVTVTGLSLTGAKAGDYVLAAATVADTIGTVTPKALTVSLTGAVSKTYDGSANATLAASNYGLAGVVGTDAVALNNPVAGSYADANAGSGKTVTVTGLALSGAAAGDYSIDTGVSGAIGVITQKTLTASLTGMVSKTYDGTTSAILAASNYSLAGVVGTDAVAITNTAGSFADRNVGSAKTVTVSGLTLVGDAAPNYVLSAATVSGGIGAITPADLTVKADNVSRTEGLPNPALTVTVTGLVGGDTAAVLTGVSAATTADINSVVGSYAITTTGGSATNYIIGTRLDGTLAVTPRAANPDVAGLNNALPASNTNYNANVVSGSLDALTGGKGGTSVTGASGSLVCDVANNDASAESCHAGGGQASLVRPTRTGQARAPHNRSALNVRSQRRRT